ncbi:E3 ubiquitin-protein ligase-like [Cololabis saira]|uniref:E3 ubiquitin-protein ligase-like n=1 Tax=Cololabis saira TaxID=129043 RepID=UPI002AD509E6|nr:E3 ubiquitin-protein ligase-like [Cololabis saira]
MSSVLQSQPGHTSVSMYSEHECGVCYRSFNAARRCPRELRCGHGFCESCLRALSRPWPAEGSARPGPDSRIDCPLCRHPTLLPGGEDLRATLRVDESALERLLAAGLLDQEEEEDEDAPAPDCDRDAPHSPAEESDPSAGPRGGRLRRSWRKVCRKIRSKMSPERGDECMTSDDLRSLAMMAWCAF